MANDKDEQKRFAEQMAAQKKAARDELLRERAEERQFKHDLRVKYGPGNR